MTEAARTLASEADADPDEQAAQNLAVLLARYTPEKHNTYMRAARAMVEAYPALVEVFAGTACGSSGADA